MTKQQQQMESALLACRDYFRHVQTVRLPTSQSVAVDARLLLKAAAERALVQVFGPHLTGVVPRD